MLRWAWIVGVLLFAVVGAVRLRDDRTARYRRFAYMCAVLFAAIPVVTGQWQWAILVLPAALVIARVMVSRREAGRLGGQAETPPAI